MITIKELYPVVHIAKHTENQQRFVVYSDTRNNNLLLRDVLLAVDDQRTSIIPVSFQAPDLISTIWEHFKSTPEQPMTYEVHGLGVDLDNLKQKYVLYFPLYERGQQLMKEQGASCLARPEEMFFSDVERDGYKGPRFRRIR